MSLSDLASAGSFISGVAVLISLIFLYFQLRQLGQQVRQAERNQQAAVRQGRSATAVDIAIALSHAESAQAAIAVRGEGDGPTEVQILQFIGLMRAVFANYEDAFYQHQEGLLDDVAFEAWKRTAAAGMRLAPRRVAWRRVRDSFGADFEAFIDQLVDATPVDRGFVADVNNWKADLAVERATAS
jgi:hypothetical protein